LISAQRIGGYAGFLKDIFGRVLTISLFGGVSSVKRRSLEFRECASQPKAHDKRERADLDDEERKVLASIVDRLKRAGKKGKS